MALTADGCTTRLPKGETVSGAKAGLRCAPILLLLGLVAAGCGSSTPHASGPAVIETGQLPPSAVLVGGAEKGGSSSGTTIPLAKQDPTTALFTALGVFQSCLKGQGVTFSGAPDPSNPNSPTNDPTYLKSLGTCAAQSDIVQALSAEKTAQENLTPKQVATENKIYLKWRTCMIGRGWGVPLPKPDSKGALFSFGTGGGGGVGQIKAPPGESLFNSPDLQACLAKAQKGTSL